MTRRALVLLISFAAACGGDPPIPPRDGTAIIRLFTPNTQDGALLIRITGEVESVSSAAAGLTVASSRQGNITRVIVTGDIGEGDIIEFRVPDTDLLASYTAFVEQAASRVDYALLDPSTYLLVIRPR